MIDLSLGVVIAVVMASVTVLAVDTMVGVRLDALPLCVLQQLPEPPTEREPLNPMPGLDQFLGQEET